MVKPPSYLAMRVPLLDLGELAGARSAHARGGGEQSVRKTVLGEPIREAMDEVLAATISFRIASFENDRVVASPNQLRAIPCEPISIPRTNG
jgi:hypothetical protein